MEDINAIVNKVRKKIMHLRMQPIRVFCFHQISKNFDSNVYCPQDWIPYDLFNRRIKTLQEEGYEFISLYDAYRHLQKNNFLRRKKYAVLTADDGLICQADIMYQLQKQCIPLTIFMNVSTLDGETVGENLKAYFGINDSKIEKQYAERIYINRQHLALLSEPTLSIGLHGYSHKKVTDIPITKFADELRECLKIFAYHPCFVPFFAYPYGTHTVETDFIVRSMHLTPVLMDGMKNYNDPSCIHRELLN